MNKNYCAIAFYHIVPIENPQFEVKEHKKLFEKLDITSRIYISPDGINGQMSASLEAAQEYIEWMQRDPRFQKIHFKLDPIKEHVFVRKTVKFREQLVAFDGELDLSERGEHISPKKWKQELEGAEPYVLIDVRNAYESKIGHFENAECPELDCFRDFDQYTEDLKGRVDPSKTKVMMYCTGGIRCEFYSAHMKKHGFDRIYQLEGGVINYGHKVGDDKWQGKLFVFDDRMAVDIDGAPAEVISHCSFCSAKSDSYYNCANMDCNELFLACPECIEGVRGCCCKECEGAERLRPFDPARGNKPFRKKHLLD